MKYQGNRDVYYTKNLLVKLTEKQQMMLGIMVDILGESRSEIVRRLLMVEAKKVAARLDGEELDLWVSLVNQIDKEADYHEFAVGEAVSTGMKRAHLERTGEELKDTEVDKLKLLADKQRAWQRNYRAKKKFERLKELEEFYE